MVGWRNLPPIRFGDNLFPSYSLIFSLYRGVIVLGMENVYALLEYRKSIFNGNDVNFCSSPLRATYPRQSLALIVVYVLVGCCVSPWDYSRCAYLRNAGPDTQGYQKKKRRKFCHGKTLDHLLVCALYFCLILFLMLVIVTFVSCMQVFVCF